MAQRLYLPAGVSAAGPLVRSPAQILKSLQGQNPYFPGGITPDIAGLVQGTQWYQEQLAKEMARDQAAAAAAATPPVPVAAPEPTLKKTVEQPELADFAKKAYAQLPAQQQQAQSFFEKYTQNLEAQRAKTAEPIDTSATKAAIDKFEANQRALVEKQRAADAAYGQRIDQMARQQLAYATRGESARRVASEGPLRSKQASGAQIGREAMLYRQVMTPFERERHALATALTAQERQNEAAYLDAAMRFQDLAFRARGLSDEEAFRLLALENDIPGLSQRLFLGQISLADAIGMLERKAVEFAYTEPYDPSRIPPTSVGTYPETIGARTYSYPSSPGPAPVLPRLTGTGTNAVPNISDPLDRWRNPGAYGMPDYSKSPLPDVRNPYRNPRSYVPIDESRSAGGADYSQPRKYAPVY